jgi:hypothetical protein
MSSDGTGKSGTTNHFGQVFRGNDDETYEGLVVTDGAIVPTALGVNPLATITALAERSVKHTADRMGVVIDYDTKNSMVSLKQICIEALATDANITRPSGSLRIPKTCHYWR